MENHMIDKDVRALTETSYLSSEVSFANPFNSAPLCHSTGD
jgi:hypothetical protein